MISLDNKYALVLSWKNIRYDQDFVLMGDAKFSGPVISISEKINENDSIQLDFSSQNLDTKLFLPNNFFIARLQWKEVEYKGEEVYLKGCTLAHNRAGTLKELKDGHRFLIDCSGHEERTHHKMLVYPAWVMNPDTVIE